MYWSSIPVGRENAITYEELCEKWQCSARAVRKILHELSAMDNGDDYVLIRSCNNKGFYLTDDRSEIERYRRECINKARHTFAPLKKITRLYKESEEQQSFFDSPLKQARQLRGLSQNDACEYLKKHGENVDPPLLSKFENSVCSPTLQQVMLLSMLYNTDPFILMNE